MNKQNIDNSIERETYFFKRGDGFIFACQKMEAWELLRGQGNWARKDFTYLGKSNAKVYQKVISEARKAKMDLIQKRNQLNKELNKYLEIEDKLRFTDLISEDMAVKDEETKAKVEKLKRVAKLIKETEEKLEPIDNDIKEFDKSIKQKALRAEIEAMDKSKLNIDNQDIITPIKKDRKKIINIMEGGGMI